MEWKAYYDNELRQPGRRELLSQWLQKAAADASFGSGLSQRTVLSFPHTAMEYSGPLQARVVSWLYQRGFKRVIALGVVHGSLSSPYRVAVDIHASSAEREAAICDVSGGFIPAEEHAQTPFGKLELEASAALYSGTIRTPSPRLLEREFSLDTFLSVLRLAADVYQRPPLRVIPMYVGMMRHPITGSFEMSAALGEELNKLWDSETAIVATGDVVHYGDFYGATDEGSKCESLTCLFREHLEHLLATAFVDRDFSAAYQTSRDIMKSDQREILPALMHLLGDGARAEVMAFELSDYARILETPPPCLVASALISYKA